MNGPRRGPFGAVEKVFFRALRPHLEMALALFACIKRNESEKQIFEETLDRLSIGTFILDGNGRVIDMNSAGRSLAAEADGLSIANERLTLASSKDRERLDRAIANALDSQNREDVASFVDALRLERPSGNVLSVLVRTIVTVDRYRSDVSPAVIVHACDPAQQRLAPEKFVGQLFGFTASESTLASLLASGLTLAEAARKMHITENTARTYSKRMFEKAGISRQAELVRLILTGVAPLARS